MIRTPFFANILRSFRPLADIFRRPFNGLWLVATLYFFWAFLVYPHSPVMHADLPDTDDYMYLTQILDWLHGQGWYDNVQHRLDPPAGVPIHFSRLVMLPMVAIIKFIELLGLGPKGSATIMAMIYPVMLLGLLFVAVRWTAEAFMSKEWAGVTAFVGIFAQSMIFQFQPGHIDHHNLIVLLQAITLGTAARMIQQPEVKRWPLYTGLVMAFGMTAALEILPWLLVLSGFVGLWAVVKGGNAARSGLLYALMLFVGSIAGLLTMRPPSDLGNLDVLTYSIVYVMMTLGMAVAFAAVFLTERLPMAVRFAIAALVAGGLGFAFLHHFPELMTGPYGGIDPALARIILDEINEAQPMKGPDNSWTDVVWAIGPSFLAIPLALWFLKQSSGQQRWKWSLLVALLLSMAGLTLYYQRRFVGTMEMLQIFPLALVLQRGWGWIGAHWRGRRQFWAEVALILLVGPLPAVLLPAIYDGRPLNTGVLLFPVVVNTQQAACESFELENLLRNPLYLGKKPLLIMNSIGEGPELLFRTQHTILAAPFHMDIAGNVDSARFFSTPYPEEAEAIARRRHVDLVVNCIYSEGFYFHNRPWDKTSNEDGPGKDFAPHFIERLITGHIPAWLKPIKAPGLNNYVVYEVLPAASGGKTTKPK